MKPLIALAAVVLAYMVALAGCAALDAAQPYDPVLAARQDAEIRRIERAEAIGELLAPVDVATAAFWKVWPVAAALLVTVGAAAWSSAAIGRYRHERQPDDRGMLPVRFVDQDAARHALSAFHIARIAEAERPVTPTTPHSLVYSPHFSNRQDAAAVLPADVAAPSISAPTFAQLLEGGRVGRGHPLLLGLDLDNGGSEVPGSWRDLYSTITAGLPGSGKTTSQRFYACQVALHGAQFVVGDPHAGAGDDSLAETLAPLRSSFLCDAADSPARILEAARFVATLGDARLHGRDTDRTPVVLWLDELTALLGRSDVGAELAATLESIAQEHRKVAVFLAASGQIWTASRATSELRDSMASVLAHRMKRGQARLLLPTDEAAMVERLGTGEAVLWRTSGATSRVRIPLTTATDVAAVAALVTSATPSTSAPGSDAGSARGSGAMQPASSAVQSPEAAHIVARFRAGASVSEIAAELSGGQKGGRRYTQASQTVAEALRRALGE